MLRRLAIAPQETQLQKPTELQGIHKGFDVVSPMLKKEIATSYGLPTQGQ